MHKRSSCRYPFWILAEKQNPYRLRDRLLVPGLVLYLINTYIPMARPIKTVLNVVVVLLVCLWLLNAFGIINVPIRLK